MKKISLILLTVILNMALYSCTSDDIALDESFIELAETDGDGPILPPPPPPPGGGTGG
jgi:hypothetical protein